MLFFIGITIFLAALWVLQIWVVLKDATVAQRHHRENKNNKRQILTEYQMSVAKYVDFCKSPMFHKVMALKDTRYKG